MAIQLPTQPWTEGDDFTVDETGVRYVYDGEKWLSESGEAADLSGFATKAFVDEIESASIFRDEAIKADLEDKDRKQTAAILVVEGDVQNEAKNRKIGDDRLQEQIDALAAGDVDLSPVEDRLDDIEAVLPKVPAVIDPVEIGEQALKITGNRPSGAGGEAGSVLMWKAEAGSGGSPYNECKFVVPDTSVVDPDAASIWWKQGDKVQRWDMGGAGWFTSGNVLHYSAAEAFGDTLVDGLPIELFYVDPALTGDDLIDTISRVESKADDRKLQVEIEEIALALETLLVQREHGQWKYIGFTGDTIPRNAGEFGLLVEDIGSSQENVITINQEDLKGITHGFGDVEVGDYVEIVNTDEPTSYALFVVTKVPEGTGIVNIEVALKDAGYNIWNGETCEIRFFAVNEQDLQVEDLDNRYLRLSGGSMDGGAVLRVNTLEPVNMPFIYYEGDPDNTHAAGLINRYMMNEHTKQYLPKSGGGMSGGINMNTNHILGVQYLGMTGAKEIQDGQTTRIKLDGRVTVNKAGTNKQGFVLRGATDQGSDGELLSVYHNADGLDAINYKGRTGGSTHLATCGYVDNAVLTTASKSLASWKGRLFFVKNGSSGTQFYFTDVNGVPTTSNSAAKKFHWRLPSGHWLQNFKGAGRDIGTLNIYDQNHAMKWMSRVISTSDPSSIVIDCDKSNDFWGRDFDESSLYIVEIISCFREK